MSVLFAPAVLSRPARVGSFVGTGRMVRFMLRRDRVRLTVWVVSLLALYAYFVTALSAIYQTEAEQQSRADLMTTPASVFMGGPAYGIDDYTIGPMFANEMSLWLIALLGTMNMFQVVRNSRAEEESGRAELVRAGAVGRHAAVAASLITVLVVDVVFIVLGSLVMVATADVAVVDTFAMSTGIGLSALVFAAVALVTAQLTTHARSASGLSMAVLGYAVIVRGIGDLQGNVAVDHGSWLSWFSPIAWTQQMRAYVDLRWWPLAPTLVTVVALVALGAWLASRRDFDGALLPDRVGPAEAKPSFGSPLSMAWRQQRTALFWWFLGTFVMFAATGTYLGEGVDDMVEQITSANPELAGAIGEDPLTWFLAIMILYAALAGGGYAIAMVFRARTEESQGRLALTLAKPVSRLHWYAAHLLVVAFGAALLTVVSGALALWLGALVNGEVDFTTFLKGGLAYSAGVAVLLALAAAIYAWWPRATPLMWAFLAFVVLVGMFGSMLGWPDAVLRISPLGWVGNYPQEPIETSHMVGLCAAAASLLALAFAGFRHRDIRDG